MTSVCCFSFPAGEERCNSNEDPSLSSQESSNDVQLLLEAQFTDVIWVPERKVK